MTRSGKTIQIIILSLIIIASARLNSQAQAPTSEILKTGTLEEQMDYIQNRTIIYDNFRAIREDMFQAVKNNSLDSLENAKDNLKEMKGMINSRNREIDSLSNLLNETRGELTQAVDNRDNIVFLGIPMDKMTYNLFVWVVIGILSVLLIFGFLLYNRNRNVTVQVLNEMESLRKDFESYKVTSREKREKLVMDHFNEIKKLKEG